MRLATALCTVLALALAGCVESDDAQAEAVEEVEAEAEAVEEDVVEEDVAEPEPEPEATPEGPEREHGYIYEDLGVTWEEAGITVTIDNLALIDHDAYVQSLEGEFDREMFINVTEGTQSVVVLDVEVLNESGHDIDFFVGQADLQIGSEQVDFQMAIGDNPGGTGVLDGTRDRGVMIRAFETPYEDLNAAGSLRFLAPGALAREDWDRLTEDLDVTVEW